jgi:7,8-dihydropterin-6-yl-methyl-4-(beta-D-ribofuranosyl)aminobenzene 5'-phosphate synthase
MDELRELVRLTIIAVVDNEIDGMTTACKACSGTGNEDDVGVASFTSHFNTLLGRDQSLDVSKMCVAAHGLSLFLEAEFEDEAGDIQQRYVLFDAGPEPAVWKNNAERLGLPLANVDAIVLSHYHIDHSGGLLAAVPDIVEAKKVKYQSGKKGQPPPLILDLHKSKIVERGFKSSVDSEMIPLLPDNPTTEELEALGAQISLQSEGHTICDGSFYVSGEIPRKTAYEVR